MNIIGGPYILAARDKESLLYDTGPWEFVRFVDDYFLDEAKARMKKKGWGIPYVASGKVKALPAGAKP